MSAPGVVFVRGTGRCGSKMMVRVLGAHPELAHVTSNELLPEALLDHAELHLAPRLPAATPAALRAGVRGFFDAFGAEQAGARGILLQKTTGQAHRIDDLLELWPDARIIYLARHPLDVVRSLISADIARFRGSLGFSATVANSALRWASDVYAFLRSQAADDPRVRVVRFETFTADPAGTLADLAEFIGIAPFARPELGAPTDYGHAFILSADERARILDATHDLVAALGYEPADFSCTVSPADAARTREHPERRGGQWPDTLDAAALLRQAVSRARATGASRIALFGAGYLARLLAARWHAEDFIAIVDEDPGLAGGTLGNLPIVTPSELTALEPDAVIPLTMVHADRLAQRCRELGPHQLDVVPLVPETAVPNVAPEPVSRR